MLSEEEIKARQRFFKETGQTQEEADVASATMLARIMSLCFLAACAGAVYWLS